MGERAVWIRSGYILEYLAKGARKPRREMVSELFPVPVRIDDDPDLALVHVDRDNRTMPILYASDGALYEGLRNPEVEVDQFEQLSREGDYRLDADSTLWYRTDLRRRGIDEFAVMSASLREELNLREIFADEREDGLRRAEEIGRQLLVSNGVVRKMTSRAPCVWISRTSSDIHLTWHRGMRSGIAGGDISRCFRVDDIEGQRAFIERFKTEYGAKPGLTVKGGGTTENITGGYRWTESGLALEDTTAWWIITTASFVVQHPFGMEASWSMMDASTPILMELIALRDELEPYAHILPVGSQASIVAQKSVDRLQTVRNMIGDDVRPHFKTLARGLDFFLDEVRISPPKPSVDADEEDTVTLGGMW